SKILIFFTKPFYGENFSTWKRFQKKGSLQNRQFPTLKGTFGSIKQKRRGFPPPGFGDDQ
ncbi:MAG: hypothetical protein J6038_04120, partial [Bacilli bacterium]|nr:hypothetical protein [Bacilli bacterium]